MQGIDTTCMKPKEIKDRALVLEYNIAIIPIESSGKKLIQAIYMSDRKKTITFEYIADEGFNRFRIVSETFGTDNHKQKFYQALYIVEKHTEYLKIKLGIQSNIVTYK